MNIITFDRNIVAALGAVIVAGTVIKTLFLAWTSTLNKIPGPWHTRFTQLALKWHTVIGRRIHYVHDLHARYGPMVRLASNEVSAATSDAFKQIYSVSSRFPKHEWYVAFGGHPTPGLFSMSDFAEHGRRRKIFARTFSKSQLRSNWEDTFRTITKKAATKINNELAENGKVDVLKWFTFMASDVSGQMMFGESWNMLDKGEKNDFIKCLEVYMQASGLAAEIPLIKTIGRLIPHPLCIRAFRGWDMVIEYASRAVDNSRRSSESMGGKNIFADVVAATEKNESLSDFDIKNEAGNFTVAGTDTSAVTMSYLVYAVLSRPDLQQTLETEAATLPVDFTDEDVEKLPWLNATISETNRLYGAAQGGFLRRAPPGGAIVEGYTIPQRTAISCQIYTLHRAENLFEDALNFKPERWFAESDMPSDAKAVYAPFGAGARTCIGIHAGLMEVRLAAAYFFRECSNGTTLAPETTPESMAFLNYFATFPISHSCNIVRK